MVNCYVEESKETDTQAERAGGARKHVENAKAQCWPGCGEWHIRFAGSGVRVQDQCVPTRQVHTHPVTQRSVFWRHGLVLGLRDKHIHGGVIRKWEADKTTTPRP